MESFVAIAYRVIPKMCCTGQQQHTQLALATSLQGISSMPMDSEGGLGSKRQQHRKDNGRPFLTMQNRMHDSIKALLNLLEHGPAPS